MAPLCSVALQAAGLIIFFSSCLHTAAPCSTATARGDTLAAGQALAAGDKLVSRNGKFALGFFQFHQTISSSSSSSKSTTTTTTVVSSPGWYLGVWFNKIPVCTAVWVSNRDRPITASELNTTQLTISSDGNLAIVASLNNTTIWSTRDLGNIIISTNGTAVSALLNSTGNLVLLPSNGTAPLWQSFDYPTDVGLPGAKIGRNKRTGFSHKFVSRKSLIDPGVGSYTIEIDANGLLQLTTVKPPFSRYWNWPSTGNGLGDLVSALNALLNLDNRTRGLLIPDYRSNSQEEYFTYSLTDDTQSVFVPLDISGQLKLNYWSQAQQAWQTVYAQPSDFCTAYAVCGPFTVCSNNNAGAGNNSSPCACMETFSVTSPEDWEVGDRTGGCARNGAHPLDCKNTTSKSTRSSSTDVFHPVSPVVLPYTPQGTQDEATQDNCEDACRRDCSCTAYSYQGGKCSIWHGELLGVSMFDGVGMNDQDVLYIRLAADTGLLSLAKKNKTKQRLVIAASVVSSGILMLILLLMIWRNRFKWFYAPVRGSEGGIIAFRYTDLVRATKNFSERLGGGGFGSVFKGVLLSESATIAVKRLDGARQGEKQFRAEVSSIGLIQHINLVKLIGFCCEGDKRLLVYEHMSNGSLDAHLFQSNNHATILSWSTRYQIAIGVARGLCYLHESCRECIIHCDIKPENILLDTSFVPKIADFGMAAIVGRDFSRVLTTLRGTAGYLAPEWLSGVAVTPKVDVYSYGMVLLELVSGKRNTPEVNSKGGCLVLFFPVQAMNKLQEGDLQSLVDPRLHGDLNLEEAERVCKVALWCIQDNDCDRPTMGEVVRVLEGLQELDMPPMPRLLAAMTQNAYAVSM